MTRSLFSQWLLGLCLLVAGACANAADEIIVIVNNDNPYTVDQAFVQKIYTGVSHAWPDGSPIFPLDQDLGGDAREVFCRDWLGRSAAAVRAIWAQNIFSGKGLPPKIVSPDEGMKRIVATNRNAIGYIHASSLDKTVKALVH